MFRNNQKDHFKVIKYVDYKSYYIMIFGHQDIFEDWNTDLKLKILESGADARALKMLLVTKKSI